MSPFVFCCVAAFMFKGHFPLRQNLIVKAVFQRGGKQSEGYLPPHFAGMTCASLMTGPS
jgi:hypothetical protein